MPPTGAQASPAAVLSSYRTLARLIQRLPQKQQPNALKQLRESYKANATKPSDEVQPLIEEAGKKIAYLRIITPKDKWRDGLQSAKEGGGSTQRWVYNGKGEGVKDGVGTPQHGSGKVVSNWSGSNMDPCSVKRHKQQLSRAGFVNNLHAKGLF